MESTTQAPSCITVAEEKDKLGSLQVSPLGSSVQSALFFRPLFFQPVHPKSDCYPL